MQLQWKWQLDLSAMHAAWCVDQLPNRTKHLDPHLHQAALELAGFSGELGTTSTRFWNTLLPLAVDGARNVDLAERTMIHLVPEIARGPARVSELAMLIGSVERAFRAVFPQYESEIQLRMEPLKQLWESHGPGLLRFIGNFTDPNLIVEAAEVYVVQPIAGGAGYAHLTTNRVHLEGVLTNIDSALPETLRLAWLLSQLDFERPVHSEMINAFHLHRIAGLAMIPPTLLAAGELELSSYSLETLQLAIQLWLPEIEDVGARILAEVVMTWWDTYQASRPEWRVALTALDRML